MSKIWNSIQNLGYHLRERKQKENIKIVLSSGYFSILTRGHVRLLESSKKLGDVLVVVVNGDNALFHKKGFVPQFVDERLEIIESLSCVDYVVVWDLPNVGGVIDRLNVDVFAKGGDEYLSNKDMNIEELVACKKNNVKIEYGVGGTSKIASSSDVFSRHLEYLKSIGYEKK